MKAFIYLMHMCCYCTADVSHLSLAISIMQRHVTMLNCCSHPCLACRMLLTLLCSCTGGAALLYALYRWVIPAAVQHHAGLALIWHDVIVERMLDTLTQSTRPQVCLQYIESTSYKSRLTTVMTRLV